MFKESILIVITMLLTSLIIATPISIDNKPEKIIRQYSAPKNLDVLVKNYNSQTPYLLVQLNLKTDSLLTLVMDKLPDSQLMRGPASYQRLMTSEDFQILEQSITPEYYQVISDEYNFPQNSRLYWVEVHEGNQTEGTWTEDEAISYDCDCLDGAVECVRLGYYAWYNPFDYWGEAWYSFDPPFHQEIQEVRVTVRGGQCDALPTSSETYMGMRNDNGGWSQDYQLSVNYTENEFVVPFDVWSNGMLMPQVGSEDNYVIDNIKLEFYYSCDVPAYSPSNLLASDGTSCSNVEINWSLSPSESLGQLLYRDNELIADLEPNVTSYQDWLATSNINHTYCIEIYNECGNSSQICNPGSLDTAPDMAQNVIASDGLYDNQITIIWDENYNTDTYKIYRDGIWLGINNVNITEYTDSFVDLNTTYEYCIESINTCGESDWSCDSGFTSAQPGDVNNDGNLNVLDVVELVNIILEFEDITEYNSWSADLNHDGLINVIDVILLVNQILNQ